MPRGGLSEDSPAENNVGDAKREMRRWSTYGGRRYQARALTRTAKKTDFGIRCDDAFTVR